MDEIEELRKRVERLRKNREKVPIEVLKTKYKKGYEELLEEIRYLAQKILKQETLKGIQIKRGDEDIIQKIQEAIDSGKFMRQTKQALFQDFSVDEFVKIVENSHAAVMSVWIPYWQEFCCLYAAPECWEEPFPQPKIYNELTDEFLVDEDKNIWKKKPEWKSGQATIITAGACRLLAGTLENREEKEDGQTGKH